MIITGTGAMRAVAGYWLETAQNGTWSAPVEHSGSSFTYVAGESPAQVRLRWKLVTGMRILLR